MILPMLSTRGFSIPVHPCSILRVPLPVPGETPTLVQGYGFWRVRVRVALKYPRVTPDNPYSDLVTVDWRKTYIKPLEHRTVDPLSTVKWHQFLLHVVIRELTYIGSFKTCTKNTSVFGNFHFEAFKVELGHRDPLQGVMRVCTAAEPEVSTTMCA